jgi:hypothetical protein
MIRRLGPMLAAGICVLALAACGGDEAGGGAEPEQTGQQQQRDGGGQPEPANQQQEAALKFTRCMRENGVDIPDPTFSENGLPRIDGPEGDPNDPAVRRAEEKCRRHLLEGGTPPTEEELQQANEDLLKFARCMREHGIDLPDPEGGVRAAVDRGAPMGRPRRGGGGSRRRRRGRRGRARGRRR